MKLSEFIVEFRQWSLGAHAEATTKANDLALRKLLAFLGDKDLCEIGPRDIDRFMSDCKAAGLKVSSVNNYIRHIRSVLNKAIAWGLIEKNPVCAVRPFREEKEPPLFIPPEQIRGFIDGIKDFDRRMVITAHLATGRRRNELTAIDWADIDFDEMKYLVRSTKAHLTAYFPINARFMEVLEQMAERYGTEGKVFSKWKHGDTVTHAVKDELRRAGIGHLHLHSLRHTFASKFVDAGGAIYTLKELLGHQNIKTTERYAHLTEQHMLDESARVDF